MPSRFWVIAIASGLASFLDAATIISVSVSLAVWRGHFGLTDWEVGLLSGGLAISVALGSVTGGWLGDRLGRARVFAMDLVLFLVGLTMINGAPGPAVLITGVLIAGLAAGADIPTSLAVISDAVPTPMRGRLIALTQTLWIAGILDGLAVGFLVSGMGYLGTQILLGHLMVLTIMTLTARLIVSRRFEIRWSAQAREPSRAILHDLLASDSLRPLLATAAFFTLWNIASTSLGSYGPYFLVTVTGLSQSQATGLALAIFPVSLVVSLAFVRLADTDLRDRIFVVAAVLQVTGFAVGAVSGGDVVAAMIILMVLYSLSNVFAGEAIYKVWSQILLPAGIRSAAMGLTYGAARAVAAVAAFFVPVVLSRSPQAVLWVLTACVIGSGLVGLGITMGHRRLGSAGSEKSVRTL